MFCFVGAINMIQVYEKSFKLHQHLKKSEPN